MGKIVRRDIVCYYLNEMLMTCQKSKWPINWHGCSINTCKTWFFGQYMKMYLPFSVLTEYRCSIGGNSVPILHNYRVIGHMCTHFRVLSESYLMNTN